MKHIPDKFQLHRFWRQSQVWLFFLTITLLSSCQLASFKGNQPVYILVHGGFHGAWCWEKVRPLLLKHHCKVLTPDLAGSGKEHGDFVQLVGNLLMKQSHPVILVGHSSGGMVISELAKQYPEKIKALVYLSAFLLPEGQSPPEVIQEDKASLLPEALVADTLTGKVRVKKELAKAVFFHDCSDSIANWAIARLTSEPQVPSSSLEPASLPTHSTGRISPPRFYIETLQDRALSITSQRRMYKKLPCQKVYSLPSSHSPFFSQPEKLTAILLNIHEQVKDK